MEPDVPHVLADQDKLRQILVNLTENAIKYSPDGGRVEVRVANAGRRVRFSVKDEGIGIAPEQQEHIFERFHRLDPNMTRGVGGLGLGLYISHELVKHMGGSDLGHVERGRGLDVHVRPSGRRRRRIDKNTQAGDGSVPAMTDHSRVPPSLATLKGVQPICGITSSSRASLSSSLSSSPRSCAPAGSGARC